MLTRMRISILIALSIAVLAAPSIASAQTTWYVDDNALGDPGPGDPTVSDPLEDGSADHPFDAIQEGIDAAVDGDTVLVLDGTYTGMGNKNLDFNEKAITIRGSLDDPALCVIDCEDNGRGFYFQNGEGPDSIVEGLTITNGDAIYGGGVYCTSHSNPTLVICIIRENSAGRYGGGVFCHDSSPTLYYCSIAENTTADTTYYGHGGGVYCGGDSSPTLTNCTINANTTYNVGGGGVYCGEYSSPTLTNCTISGNSAYSGGGVYCYDCSPVLTNCKINANTVISSGGGLWCRNSSPTLTSCTIIANTANTGGGVFCWHNNYPMLTNCTFAANTSNLGAALGCNSYQQSEPSVVTMSNCILWNGDVQIWNNDESSIAITYSDVQDGTGDTWFSDGCIDGDPSFVDPDGLDDDPDNDYRLSPSSPCIDAADNIAVPLDIFDLDNDGDTDEPLPFDLDSLLRFADRLDTPDSGVSHPDYPALPIVDMGAYEFQCIGDIDGDGDVDIADLAQLLGSYNETSGMTYNDGDLDGDGDVDIVDLAELLGAYGDTCE